MKKNKGRNYFASVGANNGTKPSTKNKKTKEHIKRERVEYAEGEKWSKAKKKRMRKVLAKQRIGGNNLHDVELDHDSSSLSRPTKKQKQSEKQNQKEKKNEKIGEITKKSLSENVDNKGTREPSHKALFSGSKIPNKMSELQKAFLDRLTGSRFRILNEELYSQPSQESLQRFQSHPELFEQYHEGFRTQVLQWPVNPVDLILKWILDYAKRKSKQRRKQLKKKEQKSKNENTQRPASSLEHPVVIADFGCGDAKLAKEILSNLSNDGDDINEMNLNKGTKKEPKVKSKAKGKKNVKVDVHSFDLVSGGNPLVTACDMANVPLPKDSVDVAVFSLALMGTNVADFIREAHRVMRADGILKIAEVRSRFESTNSYKKEDAQATKLGNNVQNRGKEISAGMDEKGGVDLSNLSEFIDVMRQLGFVCKNMDRSNQMFVMFDFEKNGKEPKIDVQFSLRPCIYKRR